MRGIKQVGFADPDDQARDVGIPLKQSRDQLSMQLQSCRAGDINPSLVIAKLLLMPFDDPLRQHKKIDVIKDFDPGQVRRLNLRIALRTCLLQPALFLRRSRKLKLPITAEGHAGIQMLNDLTGIAKCRKFHGIGEA